MNIIFNQQMNIIFFLNVPFYVQNFHQNCHNGTVNSLGVKDASLAKK